MSWTGKIIGVVNPGKVLNVAAAGINNINGVPTDTPPPPELSIDDIVEDSQGSCEYPSGSTCTADSTFSAVVSNVTGTLLYSWATDTGNIIGGNTNPTCVVRIDSGAPTTVFNVTLDVTDDAGSDQRQEAFSQTRSEAPGGPTVYVDEQFTGTDGDPILGRLPVPTPNGANVWTEVNQTDALPTIQGNAFDMAQSARARNRLYQENLPSADFIATVDVLVAAGNGGAYIPFRNTSTGTTASWYAFVNGASRLFELRKGNVLVDSIFAERDTGVLRVECLGDNIDVYWNGSLDPETHLATVDATNELVANCGLIWDRGAATPELDNFKIVSNP